MTGATRALLAAAAAAILAAAPAGTHGSDAVLVLTEHNFRQVTSAPSRPVLVYFYTDWCQRCKASAATFDALAAALGGRADLDLTVAKMDAELHEDFLQQENISGYPTIRLYAEGGSDDFNAERTVPLLLQWLRRKVGKGLSVLDSRRAVEAFVAGDTVTVVGFFKEPESAAAAMLRSVSRGMASYPFAVVSDERLFDAFAAEDGLVSVFTAFDGGRVDLHLTPTEAALRRAVRRAAQPLVADYASHDFGDMMRAAAEQGAHAGPVAFLVAFLSGRAGHYQQHMDALRSVALDHRNYSFVTVDVDKPGSAAALSAFGFEDTSLTGLPCLRVLNTVTWERFAPSRATGGCGLLGGDVLRAFLHDVNNGALEPWAEGEAEPPRWRDGVVKVLVRSTFERVVFDGRVHALVLFHGAESSEEYESVYEQVATRLAGEPLVTLAKINAVRNQVDDLRGAVEVRGHPALVLYPQCGKQPVLYDGARRPGDIVRFVVTHTGITLVRSFHSPDYGNLMRPSAGSIACPRGPRPGHPSAPALQRARLMFQDTEASGREGGGRYRGEL